ncbi:MAG: prepilin peptidase [Candidatus Pacebacteria bacterium]|nr:prepilin peptidase [Candidatus Paceibacterota bacterium]MBP9867066.1 prepilin peptidase [Candidatus Paceibacterota bacterium]
MFSILSFIFGASIGSFVQVIATRLHVAPIMKGRSKCLSCGEALRISDLIPVVSCLTLKGRCRYCKSTFGYSSLVVESIFGFVFVALYHFVLAGQSTLLFSFLYLLYYTLLFGTLGVIALYDKAHTYIPMSFLYVYALLTLVMFFVRYNGEPILIFLLAPLLVALPFLIIWLITKGKGLGFGDVLLFLGVGAFFGVSQGIAVLLISIWSGALFGLYIKYISSQKGKVGIAIPFVPFIVFAFLFVLFFDIDLFSIVSVFAR